MQIERFNVQLNFIEPVLGSLPADPEVYSKYIASKAPAPWVQDEEIAAAEEAAVKEDNARMEKGLTVFAYDEKGLYFYDYHIKGFFKEAGNTLKDTVKIKNLRSKIDNYLFIQPRRIYLQRPDGSFVKEEDEILERPLRAQTMQGPRVSLAASEKVNLPVVLAFTIEILENGKDVSWELVRELLDYGRFKGLGQWRNGSWGRFEWRLLGN